MWRDVPYRRHREVVDVADLGERDELAFRPIAWLDRVTVDPVGGVRVAADFQIFAELLVADGATLGKQELDLLEHERIALDSGRVKRLFQPDAAPNAFSLDR
jgi:hypothetical protein